MGYENTNACCYEDMIVYDATADVDKITAQVDFVFCAVDMKEEIRALEETYAKQNACNFQQQRTPRHTGCTNDYS